MKTYWDSSALVEALHQPEVAEGLKTGSNGTRPHALAEVFSTLTKGVVFRYPAEDAAKMIVDLAKSLDFVELTEADALAAIKNAKGLGVRGARIHDLMHAVAAKKYAASILMTLDTAGFKEIATDLQVRAP
jgi:predicted nucleic acid-binding protein